MKTKTVWLILETKTALGTTINHQYAIPIAEYEELYNLLDKLECSLKLAAALEETAAKVEKDILYELNYQLVATQLVK